MQANVRVVGMWFFQLLVILVVAYVAVIAFMYASQTRMLFPTSMAIASGPSLPASAVRLEVMAPDGERLRGVRIPPSRNGAGERLVILGFGGNAWNADTVAVYLNDLFPEASVVAYHYRGYAPSTGSPSAAALLADAPLIYDHVLKNAGKAPVVVVGFSIGASVAAHLASRRSVAGLIMVSPFDSLEALARDRFPWAPVGLLLRHRMSTVDAVRGLNVPTALIAAGRDTVVPPRRTQAVRLAIPNLLLDRTIARAGHNDLYDRRDFRTAMIEALQQIKMAQGAGKHRR